MPRSLLRYPTDVQVQLREVSVRCQNSRYRGKGESGIYLHHVDTATQALTANTINYIIYSRVVLYLIESRVVDIGRSL